MRRTAEDFLRLRAELESDMAAIDEFFGKNRKATGRITQGQTDELDWAALGYTLHNLYCAFENYFLRVAKFFENGLDRNSWHRELVERMTLEVEGLRPRLFDVPFARRIDELRRFRHAFRNVYQSELDPRRLALLNGDIETLIKDFGPFHEAFLRALERIGEAV